MLRSTSARFPIAVQVLILLGYTVYKCFTFSVGSGRVTVFDCELISCYYCSYVCFIFVPVCLDLFASSLDVSYVNLGNISFVAL